MQTQQIYESVMADYNANATELCDSYFDFHVKAKKKDLLEIYKMIQKRINGDDVLALKNESIENMGSDQWVLGTVSSFDEIPELHEVFDGNFKELLNSYNNSESKTHLYRIMDAEFDKKEVTGIKLDFIY